MYQLNPANSLCEAMGHRSTEIANKMDFFIIVFFILALLLPSVARPIYLDRSKRTTMARPIASPTFM